MVEDDCRPKTITGFCGYTLIVVVVLSRVVRVMESVAGSLRSPLTRTSYWVPRVSPERKQARQDALTVQEETTVLVPRAYAVTW